MVSDAARPGLPGDAPPRVPWLWLFGASGAGKTAAGFELYRQLAAEGRRVGFVDLDQIGICLPDDDPVRGPIKTANLQSALRSFADVGAEGVVVVGDVSGPPMQRILGLSAEAPRTVRLRASAGEYERRLRRRGAPAPVIARSKVHDTRFPRAGDIDVDTEGRDVAEVARAIRRALPDWPLAKAPPTGRVGPLRPARRGGRAVLVAGPTPVGKSTVAWELLTRSASGGVLTGFLDLAQIGFFHAPGNPEHVTDLKARNIAAMWDNFARRGARRLILSGDLDHATDLDRYRRALGATELDLYVLTASPDTLVSRARRRGRGHPPELPGDPLRGQPPPRAEAIARQAARAEAHRPPLPTARYLRTDGRDPGAVADAIADRSFGDTFRSG